jgi:hypothetical protein
MRFAIRPPTRVAAAALNAPSNQGSEMNLWYGTLDVDTGVLIGAERLFWGKLNQPRYAAGKGPVMTVEMDVNSALAALFATEEGQRLNHAFHTKYAPGDNFLEFVVDVERKLPWGSEAQRPPLVSAANGGYGASQGGGIGIPADTLNGSRGGGWKYT